MARIRRINVSQIEGNSANTNNEDEIRPYGEIGLFEGDWNQATDRSSLELLIFDGSRVHLRSKVLAPGVFYGSGDDSGDQTYGYDTIKLIPDAELHYNNGGYGNDQYLIVDPTVPNHIHIRAGGTQDNSNAQLFLGGEISHFSVGAGNNPPLYLKANDNQWTLGTDGAIYLPVKGALHPVDDNAGLVLYDTDNSNRAQLAAIGDINLRTDSTNAGKEWTFNTNGDLTVPNYIYFKDGSFIGDEGGAEPPVFRIDAPIGLGINLTTDSGMEGSNNVWTFGVDGDLTIPGDIIGYQKYIDENPIDERVTIQPSGSIDKPFKFITDQNSGTWLRSMMELPVAEVGKAVTMGFPHDDNSIGYIYTQGTDTISATEFNNAFNIMGNGTDVKIGTVSPDGNKVWKFDRDGDLTFPDSTVQTTAWLGTVSYDDLTDKPTLATVATSGSYNDLSDLPAVPPAIENVSELTNDAGYITNTVTGDLTVSGTVTASNFEGSITITGDVIGTSANVELVAGDHTAVFDNTGVATFPGDLKGDILVSTNSAGDEGGEISLAIPVTNTTLSGSVTVDVYRDKLRIFQGDSSKGVSLDLAKAPEGVGGELTWKASGLVNAGTFVTMDLLKATVTTSGQRGLSLASTTGSFNILIGGNYALSNGSVGGGSGTATVTTTAGTSQFNWNFTMSGDISTYIITDTTNSRAYRITLQIGASYNNNFICIERLY